MAFAQGVGEVAQPLAVLRGALLAQRRARAGGGQGGERADDARQGYFCTTWKRISSVLGMSQSGFSSEALR